MRAEEGIPGARIVLVEDEVIIACELKVRLASLGHAVLGSLRKGEDAVPVALTKKPDLLLIDITLAGAIDGIETAKRIRAAGPARIIFVTANTDEGTRQRALALDPDGFLLKPFSQEELQVSINKALSSIV